MTRFSIFKLTIVALVIFRGVSLFAIETAYNVSLSPWSEEGLLRGELQGSMTFTALPQASELCLYLPFNDPFYHHDPIKGVQSSDSKIRALDKKSGKIVILGAKNLGVWLTPYILKLSPKALPFSLAFEASLPRWAHYKGDSWVLADFYPIPLRSCPEQGQTKFNFRVDARAKITLQYGIPSGWISASPGEITAANSSSSGSLFSLKFVGRSLPIFVGRGYGRRLLQHGGLALEILYQIPGDSDDPHDEAGFGRFLPMAVRYLDSHSEIFGDFPYERLIVVESQDVEASLVPGLIAINRPRQIGLNELQQDYFSMTAWVLCSNIAEQWFTGPLAVGLDDFWFALGSVDFAVYEALKREGGYFDFFPANSPLKRKLNLSFDYRQKQDLMGLASSYLDPKGILVDAVSLRSIPYKEQHPVTYVRHALALRYLAWYFDDANLKAKLRDFFTKVSYQPFTPENFLLYIGADEHQGKDPAASRAWRLVENWWSTDKWPDFILKSVEEKDGIGQKLALVSVEEKGGFHLPVDVVIKTTDGKEFKGVVAEEQDHWQAAIPFDGEISKIEVNPGRELYDRDRFDNSSTVWPEFNFFPGFLADDAYSVFILPPLPIKRPGEEWTLGSSGGYAKYLHSFLTSSIAWVPEEKRLGLNVFWMKPFKRTSSALTFNLLQDFGNAYKGERAVEASIGTFTAISNHFYNYDLIFRHRAELGRFETAHETLSISLGLQTKRGVDERLCSFNGKAAFEKSLSSNQEGFFYQRRKVYVDAACSRKAYEISLRTFRGTMEYQGPPSGNVLFIPNNLDESRLRLVPSLTKVRDIFAVGADFTSPLPLPLADKFWVLGRDIRLRLFYDYGEAKDHQWLYRALGTGLLIPFGGDIVGRRSMIFGGVSIMVVGFQQYEGQTNRTPALLLDWNGKM